MRKAWIGVVFVFVLAGAFAFQTYRDFARPQSFQGCFNFEGRRLVLNAGRLTIDGADLGSFRYLRGDASKGPDTISLGAPTESLRAVGIDPRRLWLVAGSDIQLPIENGGYQLATPCRS
jgi:hypothetical protein